MNLLVMTITLPLWAAFVIMHLWAWFCVPLGLPPITLGTAFGLDLLVSYTTATDLRGALLHVRQWDKLRRSPWELWGAAMWMGGQVLAMGWLVHWLMTR